MEESTARTVSLPPKGAKTAYHYSIKTQEQSGFTHQYQRSLESWQEQADGTARGSNREAFILFDGVHPAGMAALYRREDQSETGDLLQMWVLPELYVSGTTRTLLEGVFTWAKQVPFRRILAQEQISNSRLLTFYRKCGV